MVPRVRHCLVLSANRGTLEQFGALTPFRAEQRRVVRARARQTTTASDGMRVRGAAPFAPVPSDTLPATVRDALDIGRAPQDLFVGASIPPFPVVP